MSFALFSFQISQKHQDIQQKLKIDSEFVVNSIKMGDLYFITKYLAAFVESDVVDGCGIKKDDSPGWIGISPEPSASRVLLDQGISAGLFSTTFTGNKKLADRTRSSWTFYYTYKINHFFYLYAAIISLIISLLTFFFLKHLLKQAAVFISEPIENLYKDIDTQILNPTDHFTPQNYNQGRNFQETDRFVHELNRLLETVNAQNTKMKKAEIHEALFKLSRQVNHDIQSPLGSLTTAIDHLEKDKEAAINLIKKSAKRIQSIVSDLKIDETNGHHYFQKRAKIEINNFIDGLLKEKKTEYQGVADFEFTAHEEDVLIEIDPDRVARALSNLINNGIEAVHNGKPKIRVEVFANLDTVEISIIDNGPGIPKELTRKIFEYGFTSGKKGGSGLGLAQAAEVAEVHGGSLKVGEHSVSGFNVLTLTLIRKT